MKALVTTEGEPPGVRLETRPDPEPGPGEVLVEVHAVGVNRADVLLARHRPPGSPLGLEAVGTVVRAAADGSGPAAGVRVTGLTDNDGWAELVRMRTDRLAVVPSGLADAVAAALPVAGLTAWFCLQRAGWLLGRSVLVTGTSGAVGGMAVQLAAAAGAEVVGWAGVPGRARALAELGHRVVADGSPVPRTADVVVDGVGGEVFHEAFKRLGRDGVAIVYGNTVRADLQLPPDWGHARAGVRLEHLFLLDEVTRRHPGENLGLLVNLAAHRGLHPHIGLESGWADAAGALAALLERRITGKAVLTL